MPQVKIGILGVGGRMGKLIAREVFIDNDAYLIGGTVRSTSELRGADLGDLIGGKHLHLPLTDDVEGVIQSADVVIDFTHESTTKSNAELALKHKKALVVGTTGLHDAAFEALKKASQSIPLFYAKNMSVGAYLLREAVYKTAKFLGHSADIEILELHHRHKKDAPSGTALDLVEAVAEARGKEPSYHVWGKTHDGARPYGEVGLAVQRGGDSAGEHSVMMFCPGETLTFKHTAYDRSIFARGALKAALWLGTQKPGLYGMKDLIS